MEKFIPAARFAVLNSVYDSICSLLGLGENYRKKTLEYLKFQNKKARVLDAGCGTGTLGIELKKKYPSIELHGADADEGILKLAKRKSAKAGVEINFQKAYIQKLPFPKNHFDFVYSSLVFHHLPKKAKQEAMGELYRVLKKDGILFISDFGKPKGMLASILPFLAVIFEEGYDNYNGNLACMLKAANFNFVEEVGDYNSAITFISARK